MKDRLKALAKVVGEGLLNVFCVILLLAIVLPPTLVLVVLCFGIWLPNFWIGLWVGFIATFFFCNLYHRKLEEKNSQLTNRVLKREHELDAIYSERIREISNSVEEFLTDTPMTCHRVKWVEDRLVIEIGDDERMVKVDMDYAKETGIVQALERAKLKWIGEA